MNAVCVTLCQGAADPKRKNVPHNREHRYISLAESSNRSPLYPSSARRWQRPGCVGRHKTTTIQRACQQERQGTKRARCDSGDERVEPSRGQRSGRFQTLDKTFLSGCDACLRVKTIPAIDRARHFSSFVPRGFAAWALLIFFPIFQRNSSPWPRQYEVQWLNSDSITSRQQQKKHKIN
ncbi:hypothetical protein VTK26DRAFT_1361 [Humicola hyalothermophila]